jgi:hypothetical protein
MNLRMKKKKGFFNKIIRLELKRNWFRIVFIELVKKNYFIFFEGLYEPCGYNLYIFVFQLNKMLL